MHIEISINAEPSNYRHIKTDGLKVKYSVSGDRILRYYIDFRHTALNVHKVVSAPEISILQNKVDTLMASWDKKYEAHKKKESLTEGKKAAENIVVENEAKRNQLRHILYHTLEINDEVDWEILKNHSKFKKEKFPEPRPKNPPILEEPTLRKIGIFQILFGQRERIELENKKAKLEHEKLQEKREKKIKLKLERWRKRLKEWNEIQSKKKEEFIEKIKEENAKVDALKTAWSNGSEEAVVEHANIVLENSTYENFNSKEFDIQYNSESKTLLVEYLLPPPNKLPTVKNVRFIVSTGELKETHISAKDKKNLFDHVCYQICLRTIHELFEADTYEHIKIIVFNGSVKYIDKATGNDVHSIILSLMVNREEFLAINLSNIEPKLCFKNLKGVSASSLIGLTPIAPIMQLDKEDRRFIDSRHIKLGDDGATNLAAMDWEEFEHLVREIFGKEFSSRGGEVKITQSSRDGGVDAIAFDPDPISGGKTVIQAKRYSKTVGVAAVRDLYGTTMNEGANKGILITTSNFGPDAYKFASDKPLTLMTGGHLLHLLEKHGIKAKIDLKEARQILGLKGSE